VYVDMKVEIWSDFVSPLCYIAKRNFELALEKFEHQQFVQVEFKSYLLHESAMADDDYKELLMKSCKVSICQFEGWVQQLIEQADALNLPFQLESMCYTNTLDAHRLVKYATCHDKEYQLIDGLFQHFFSATNTGDKSLDDKETSIKIAEGCGLEECEVAYVLSIEKYKRDV